MFKRNESRYAMFQSDAKYKNLVSYVYFQFCSDTLDFLVYKHRM